MVHDVENVNKEGWLITVNIYANMLIYRAAMVI